MNHRLQTFVEEHPWAAPLVAVINWLLALMVWCVDHPTEVTRWFTTASAILGFGVMWYSFRIKRREFRRGESKQSD